MPVSTGTGLTPFADEATRLLREKWANPTMLAEEVYPILQSRIPLQRNGPININLLYGTDQTAITLRQNGDGPFMRFIGSDGKEVAIVDGSGYRQIQPRNSDPFRPRILPVINWSNPDPIDATTPLSSTQLNAEAVDPISLKPIDGTYVYDPADGATLAPGTQTLSVVFTPTNTVTYKRARKTVDIEVTAGAAIFIDHTTIPSPGVSPPISVTMGQLLIVFVYTTGNGTDPGTTATVTDSDGNTYTQIGSYVQTSTAIPGPSTGYFVLSAWYAVMAADSAALAIVADGPDPFTFDTVAEAFRYGNVNTGGPIETSADGTGSGLSPGSGDSISLVNITSSYGNLVVVVAGNSMGLNVTGLTSGLNNGFASFAQAWNDVTQASVFAVGEVGSVPAAGAGAFVAMAVSVLKA